MSVNQFLSYLELEKNYSAHTITAYRKDLSSFSEYIESKYNGQDLVEVHYSQIRSWIVRLVESGLTNRTVNRKISSLKSYYKFLQNTGQLEMSPLARHTALKSSQKIQIPFSQAEIEKVLESFDTTTFEGLRDKLIVEMFYSTGIRRSELIEIKLQHLDLDEGSLKVRGKRNKERHIPLLPSVVGTSRDYLRERKLVEKNFSDGYFFLTSSSVKMNDSLVYRLINNYFRGVSTKTKKSPHILRHSFATHLLNQGADINAVKELLGHTSLAATQVYINSSMAEINRIYKNAHPRSRKK